MAYVSLDDLKAVLSVDDDYDDATLQSKVNAACQAVDDWTRRTFSLATSATARTFKPIPNKRLCDVDDIGSLTGLAVATSADGATWTAQTGFVTQPSNALAWGEPITEILFTSCSLPLSPYGADTVQVTATWGWPAVPAPVIEATLLIASRLFHRKDSPWGVAGFGDLGVVRTTVTDADVKGLLTPYRRVGVR